MNIIVTTEHVEQGIPCRGLRCPVALAVRDIFPNAQRVFTGPDCTAIDDSNGQRKYYKHAPSLVQAVRDYDNSGVFSPGEYVMYDYERVPSFVAVDFNVSIEWEERQNQ